MVVIEAQEAWWPPTFRPSRLSRRWLALWIVQVESQRRRASMCSSDCTQAFGGGALARCGRVRFAAGGVMGLSYPGEGQKRYRGSDMGPRLAIGERCTYAPREIVPLRVSYSAGAALRAASSATISSWTPLRS